MQINDIITAITVLDEASMAAARARQDMLTKPQGSLGRLEELSIQLAGITRACPPPVPSRKTVLVFAGDHGVVAQGVSAFPQEVTPQMVCNFLRGGAAINVLARQAGARVVVIDAGVAAPLAPAEGLIDGKVAPGTADMSLGPAMTPAQAYQALALGVRVAQEEIAAGWICWRAARWASATRPRRRPSSRPSPACAPRKSPGLAPVSRRRPCASRPM